ncbi:MAG: SprT family zinc-dependent metalloprotease [Pseudomonadota bacterium]
MPRAQHLPSEFTVEGCDAPIALRFVPTARRMTLRVNQAKRTVRLSAPASCSVEQARQFAAQQVGWINDRLGSLAQVVAFQDEAVIPLRGAPRTLRFVGIRGQGPDVQRDDGAVTSSQVRLLVNDHGGLGAQRLEAWLKEEAKADLRIRVAHHARRLNVAPQRITVRDQSSRWGSCSSKGALSFSWRLILAEPFVLDYVAAHEVAHLREMNHSHRFWALVRETLPDYERAENWLRRHGAGLHRYGAATPVA